MFVRSFIIKDEKKSLLCDGQMDEEFAQTTDIIRILKVKAKTVSVFSPSQTDDVTDNIEVQKYRVLKRTFSSIDEITVMDLIVEQIT